MSAHFAIPATTFVLRAIIEARLKAAYGNLAAPRVSVEPPPRPPPPAQGNGPAEASGIILFMHHAGPNPGWRNMYDPHLDATGKRVAKAPLVLDLHYLLAAQGSDLEREALLGIGMSALHRNGVVPRNLVQQLLSAVAVPQHPTRLIDSLTGEPLHDPANQPENITVTQQAVDVDTSTKLWSAFQSPMRPCAYYLVTTVFLDTAEQYPAPQQVEKVVVSGRPSPDPAAAPDGDAVLETGAPP